MEYRLIDKETMRSLKEVILSLQLQVIQLEGLVKELKVKEEKWN